VALTLSIFAAPDTRTMIGAGEGVGRFSFCFADVILIASPFSEWTAVGCYPLLSAFLCHAPVYAARRAEVLRL
jgi:hypothetical protein